MTGIDLTNRLLKNIETSLELRSRIPYLDMLKDLVQGGASISTSTLNTSSNFGSFDTALKEALVILNNTNSNIIPAPPTLPLPLTAIHNNLSTNLVILSEIIQSNIDNQAAGTIVNGSDSNILLYKLETIHLAAV